MSVFKNLANVQKLLKAPKGQYNSFGKYKYRSCEDILEAAKPLCIENGLILTVSDKVLQIGDRYYVEATATVTDVESSERHSVTASARESETKKGMDDSQITGTASSYARKYALNGLFAIDDTKDDDSNEHHTEKKERANKVRKINDSEAALLTILATQKGYTAEQVCKKFKLKALGDMDEEQYKKATAGFNKLPDANA